MDAIRSLKHRLKLGVRMLPWGDDLFLFLNARSQGIAYRGVFDSHADALAAVRHSKTADYDASFNRKVADSIARGDVDITNWIHDHDYPLLFWLTKALDANTRVVEFGGSLGHLFYSTRTLLPLGEDVVWTILELPDAVSAGRELAAQMQEPRLRFEVSTDRRLPLRGDLFLSAGALQYSEASTVDVIDEFETPPQHVLLHTMPAHAEREFWTLQRIDDAELPYRILSIASLRRDMDARGYDCIRTWKHDRSVRIPFRDDISTDGYFGFYFRLR